MKPLSQDGMKIREEVIYHGLEVQTEAPSKQEVWEIIKTLNNSKSPGEYISAELNTSGFINKPTSYMFDRYFTQYTAP
jgi:hypothetical protein